MFHTVGWRESIADIVEADIQPVVDQIMAINNNHFVPQRDMFLQYVYGGAAGITDARLDSPSFRQFSSPRVRPINLAIVPVDEPNIADYRANPLRARALEELEFLAAQTTGGAAVVVGLAALSDSPLQIMPQGDIYTMLGVGTTTVTAGAWSPTAITWADTLPNGRYAVVGFEAVGVTCVGARLTFENQWQRPGCLGQSLVSGAGPAMFRKGGLGVWGYFDTFRMPSVEFLCNAADTAQTVFLDVMKVG